MFQRETIPVSFEEKCAIIYNIFKALNDTLVFLVEQKTEESGSDINNIKSEFVLLHTDTHGKHLFRKVMRSKSATVEMISPK